MSTVTESKQTTKYKVQVGDYMLCWMQHNRRKGRRPMFMKKPHEHSIMYLDTAEQADAWINSANNHAYPLIPKVNAKPTVVPVTRDWSKAA